MKKALIIVLAVAMVVSIAACSKKGKNGDEKSTIYTSEEIVTLPDEDVGVDLDGKGGNKTTNKSDKNSKDSSGNSANKKGDSGATDKNGKATTKKGEKTTKQGEKKTTTKKGEVNDTAPYETPILPMD